MPGLCDEKRTAYFDNGAIFPVDVLTADEAKEHRRSLEKAEAEHGPMHYRVKPYLLMTSTWQIATHPVLLDAIEAVLGPDILLWDSSYVIKEPATSNFVSWHQDLTYWGLDMPTPDDLVTAWVALTPAKKANGCMKFVRGSHRQGKFVHEDTYDKDNLLHRGQAIPDQFSADQISHIELEPGQASLHHGWTVHASNPNPSDVRRVGLVLNYLKPSVRQVVGERETATLLRGSDNYGYYDSEPACESDFAAANVEFQLDVENRKRDVYDTA